jgi:outer membrane protein TolC
VFEITGKLKECNEPKNGLFLVFFFIILTLPAFASTWQDVLGTAGKNSNSIKAAEKQAESSRWTYLKSYSSFLPQLSASMSMSQTESGTSSAVSKSYSYGLSANQTLFSGLSNYYNVQSSFAQYSIDQANLIKTKSDAFYDLRIAFINQIIAQENIKLQKNILDRLIENERLVKLQYESGKEDKGNLMQTSANRKSAEFNLASAQRALSLAGLKLSQLLGYRAASLEAGLEPVAPQETDFGKLSEDSPSYISAKYQLEQSEIAQKETISGFLPDVSLSGSWRRSGANWPPDSENKNLSLNLSY